MPSLEATVTSNTMTSERLPTLQVLGQLKEGDRFRLRGVVFQVTQLIRTGDVAYLCKVFGNGKLAKFDMAAPLANLEETLARESAPILSRGHRYFGRYGRINNRQHQATVPHEEATSATEGTETRNAGSSRNA